MTAPVWEPGGDIARLAYCLGWATHGPEYLVEVVTADIGGVLGSVVGFGEDWVNLRRPNGALVTIPTVQVLEVHAPEVQTSCTCGTELDEPVVVDGPHYPQLCAACKATDYDGDEDMRRDR